MLISEFNVGNAPPLPPNLSGTIEQYLVDLISYAQGAARKIDELENDGAPRQQRMYGFRITDFPGIEFSIRIPTRHHYRLENLGLPEVNSPLISNSFLVSNQSLISS